MRLRFFVFFAVPVLVLAAGHVFNNVTETWRNPGDESFRIQLVQAPDTAGTMTLRDGPQVLAVWTRESNAGATVDWAPGRDLQVTFSGLITRANARFRFRIFDAAGGWVQFQAVNHNLGFRLAPDSADGPERDAEAFLKLGPNHSRQLPCGYWPPARDSYTSD